MQREDNKTPRVSVCGQETEEEEVVHEAQHWRRLVVRPKNKKVDRHTMELEIGAERLLLLLLLLSSWAMGISYYYLSTPPNKSLNNGEEHTGLILSLLYA